MGKGPPAAVETDELEMQCIGEVHLREVDILPDWVYPCSAGGVELPMQAHAITLVNRSGREGVFLKSNS